MKELTERQMEILKLWNPYGPNLSERAIAKFLGISYSTVNEHLHYASKKFKRKKDFERLVAYKKYLRKNRKKLIRDLDLTRMQEYGEIMGHDGRYPYEFFPGEKIREVF